MIGPYVIIFKGTNLIFKLRKTELSSTFRICGNFPQLTTNVTKMQVFMLKTKKFLGKIVSESG